MAINIGRSVKIALAQRDKNSKWLAEQMGVSRTRASAIANNPNASSDVMNRLADIFEIPASELIALGETDNNEREAHA